MRFGHYLKELRQAMGLSRYKVSQLSSIDQGNLCRYETSERGIALATILKFAEIYNIDWRILVQKYIDLEMSGKEKGEALCHQKKSK